MKLSPFSNPLENSKELWNFIFSKNMFSRHCFPTHHRDRLVIKIFYSIIYFKSHFLRINVIPVLILILLGGYLFSVLYNETFSLNTPHTLISIKPNKTHYIDVLMQGWQVWLQSGSDWPQMGQIRGFFRSDFSVFGVGTLHNTEMFTIFVMLIE